MILFFNAKIVGKLLRSSFEVRKVKAFSCNCSCDSINLKFFFTSIIASTLFGLNQFFNVFSALESSIDTVERIFSVAPSILYAVGLWSISFSIGFTEIGTSFTHSPFSFGFNSTARIVNFVGTYFSLSIIFLIVSAVAFTFGLGESSTSCFAFSFYNWSQEHY